MLASFKLIMAMSSKSASCSQDFPDLPDKLVSVAICRHSCALTVLLLPLMPLPNDLHFLSFAVPHQIHTAATGATCIQV